MDKNRVYRLVFASVYPLYIKKAEAKGRTKEEVDTIIFWLTGYNIQTLQKQIDQKMISKHFSPRHLHLIRMFQKLQV